MLKVQFGNPKSNELAQRRLMKMGNTAETYQYADLSSFIVHDVQSEDIRSL